MVLQAERERWMEGMIVGGKNTKTLNRMIGGVKRIQSLEISLVNE